MRDGGEFMVITRLLLVVALVSLVSGLARAEPSDADRATARSLAREGAEAQQHGQYAIAADRFARAEALVHAPTLLLGLARAQVGLSRLLEAQETYQRILREPVSANAPAAFGKALEDSKRELAALAPRLGWVRIDVGGATSPTVTLDDVPVPVAALGVRRACNPGAHWVKASAAGFAPAESTFVLAEGGEQAVTLSLDALPRTAEVVAVEPKPQTAPATPMTTNTKLAIVSFAVGAVGWITGGVAGILSISEHSWLNPRCAPNDLCPPVDADELHTYRTVADLSTVALIVGGFGTAVGVTLLLTSPKSSPVSLYVGPMSAGAVGAF
jgi:hypothetical protein